MSQIKPAPSHPICCLLVQDTTYQPSQDLTSQPYFSPMNINANVLNKVLAKQLQDHINKIIHHNQVYFIAEIQV